MSTIQISINTAQKTIVLDVEPSATISHIKTLVKEQDASLETSNLIYDDKPLEDDKTLEDYEITTSATLMAEQSANKTTVVTTTQTPKRKRNKCSFKSCTSAPLRGVGYCSSCDGAFCGSHRLYEAHKCASLDMTKELAFQRNADKLHNQQTQASKVQ